MVYGTYTVTIVSGAYKLTYNWGASHCIFLCAMFNSYVYVTNYQRVRCFCVFPNGQWDGSREHLHRKPRIFPGNMGGASCEFSLQPIHRNGLKRNIHRNGTLQRNLLVCKAGLIRWRFQSINSRFPTVLFLPPTGTSPYTFIWVSLGFL